MSLLAEQIWTDRIPTDMQSNPTLSKYQISRQKTLIVRSARLKSWYPEMKWKKLNMVYKFEQGNDIYLAFTRR